MKRLLSSFCLLSFSIVMVGFVALLMPTAAYAQASSCAEGTVNVSEYVAPKCEGECPVIMGSSVDTLASHIGNVRNQVEWVDGTTFKQKANDVHFLYRDTGNVIQFLQDTIWPGFNCTDGRKAIYRPYNGSRWGMDYLNSTMSCGEKKSHTSELHAYSKPSEIETNPLLEESIMEGKYACDVAGQSYKFTGTTEGTVQLIFQGPAKCINVDVEAIAVNTLSGPGAGEVLFYCKGYGLCAWYQKLDTSNPASWKNEDICNLEGEEEIDPYYLYPIKTITGNASPDMIRAELVLQGYEAHCTVPKIEGYVKDDFTTKDLELFPQWIDQLFKLTPRYTYDYSQSLVPLWRNMNVPVVDITNKESLEGYYGHHDPSVTDPILKKYASGPIYRLTSLEEQCRLQVDILRAIDRKCGDLEDPTKCALNIDIPETTLKARGLYQLYQNSGLNCNQIATLPQNQWKTSLNPADKEMLATGLQYTPLYMPEAYRLAFLVVYAEIKKDVPAPNLFNFLSAKFLDAPNFSHDVRIIAFKIPDVATNKHDILVDMNQFSDLDAGEKQQLQALIGNRDESSYKDPLQLAAQEILSIAEQEKREKSWLERKIRDLTKDSFVYNQKDAHTIKCETAYCQQPAVRAIIDFANVSLLYRPEEKALCDTPTSDQLPEEDKIAEEVNTIRDEGGLLYDDDEPNSLENVTDDQGISQEPETASASDSAEGKGAPPFEFLAEYWLTHPSVNDRKGRFSPFRAVLVYPQGQELTNIEDAMGGLIYTEAEIEKLRTDPAWQQEEGLMKYFELSSTGTDFPEDSQEVVLGRDFECVQRVLANYRLERADSDSSDQDTSSEESGPDLSQCDITRRVYTSAEKPGILQQEPRILGGILGFITRKVQQAYRFFADPTYEAVADCKTTEDFLLNRCKPDDKKDEDDDDAISCTDSSQEHKEAVNGSAIITNGIIQLAMEVSERTCTPVEVLIGMLAKESRGLDFDNRPITGDPNQSVCRSQSCVNGTGGGSGPYSFTQSNFNAHRTHGAIAPLYNDCINGLSVTLSDGEKTLTAGPDARIVGHSMCLFSANFWRYMSLQKSDSRLTTYPKCEGANKRTYALSEISQNDLDYFIGVHCAPGYNDPDSPNYIYNGFCTKAIELFNKSIRLYEDDVQAVVAACKG